MKNIKILGLACIAMLALAASLGAASASASQFRSEAYPVTFKVKGGTAETEAFRFRGNGGQSGGNFRCETGSLSGSASGASSAASLTPSYSGCTINGIEASFNPNGCRFVLHSTNESTPYEGTMDIACANEGESIEALSAAACKLTIPAQNGVGAVEFSNAEKGSARTVFASTNLTGVKYTFAEGCWKQTVGTFEGGTLRASMTIAGSDENGTYGLGVYMANEQIAEPPLFRLEEYPGTVSGEVARPRFHFQAANFFCGTSSLTAGMEAETAEMPASPVFTECTVGGGVFFVVEHHGCQFTLSPAEGGPPNTGGMSLTCPGTPLTFASPFCTITIGSQEWPSSVKFENTGTGNTRGVKWNTLITNIKYEQSNCFGGSGSFNDGELEAAWLLQGSNANEEKEGLWIE